MASDKHIEAEIEEKKTLCRHGFHEWVEVKADADEHGRQAKTWKCKLCGKKKIDK